MKQQSPGVEGRVADVVRAVALAAGRGAGGVTAAAEAALALGVGVAALALEAPGGRQAEYADGALAGVGDLAGRGLRDDQIADGVAAAFGVGIHRDTDLIRVEQLEGVAGGAAGAVGERTVTCPAGSTGESSDSRR